MSFGRQFDFHHIIIWHCNVDNIDGLRSLLQLLDVKMYDKNRRFSLNKSCGKFLQAIQNGGIVIDHEGFVHIFNLFV